MLRAARAVFRKELVEAVRDRRTLLLGLLLPLLVMPAVTLGLPSLALREEARLRDAPARVAVSGGPPPEAFLREATARGWFEVVAVGGDPTLALRRGAIHALLEALPGTGSNPTRLRVLYDEGSVASLLARQKIDRAVAQYSLERVEAQLVRRGLSARQLLAIEVEHVPIGAAGGAGRTQLAMILPFFMTVWMLLGGQYAALDLGAGERERGTLPGLLLTPPGRLALVLGKFATVFSLATTSVVLVIAAVLVSLRLAPSGLGSGALAPGALATLAAVGLVFAASLSALQLLLSLVARSVREAQQLFTPVYLLAVGAVLLTQIAPEWGQRLWLYALPGVNGAFLLRALLLGGPDAPQVVLTVLTLAAATGLTLAAGAWVYGRERLVAG